MRSRRAEWAQRVRQWRRSDLTASEFAEVIGVNAGTLSHWAWRLGREKGVSRGEVESTRGQTTSSRRPQFIELLAGEGEDRRFELELGGGRRLRIPAGFDTDGLKRLLAVLGER